MKCRNCGFITIDNDIDICVKCGSNISVEQTEKPSNSNTIVHSLKQEERSEKKPLISNKSHTRIIDVKNQALIDENIDAPTEINKQPEFQEPKSSTQYFSDFDITNEENVQFELHPLGADTLKPIKIYEDDIFVKRQDIDKNDTSISSKDHMRIYKKNGQWHLKNLSSNGALFLRVKNEVVLGDNDIIIIGKHKTFMFKPQK